MELKNLLAQPGAVLMPGAGSPLEARLIEQAGYDVMYLSGYATAAVGYGLPDIGLIAREEVASTLSRVRAVTDLPIVIDADTGYGDAEAVGHTVRTLARLGASAIQIEDQVWPKRCGHMTGKAVEQREVAFRKVQAAVKAGHKSGALIVARTDSRAPLGLEEAILRAHEFASIGADIVFIDAPQSEAELREIGGSGIDASLIVNVSEGGLTPALSLDEFAKIGFDIVMYPSNGARVMAKAVQTFLADLKRQGDSVGLESQFVTLDGLNEIVGLQDFQSFGAEFLSENQR